VRPQLYRLSAKLIRRIRKDPRNQTAIAFPHGLTQSQLSQLTYRRQRFSDALRPRIESLGAGYALEPGECFVRDQR
jgi:hypothetical protein